MSAHRQVVKLTAVVTLLTRFKDRAPDLLDELENRMGDFDGFRHDLSYSDMPKGKGPPTSVVEAQATGELLRLSQVEQDIKGHIDTITLAAYALHDLANEYVPQKFAAPMCDASGRDWAVQWQDANCTDLASKGGLCARCYKRETRWRQANGKPSRSEPAA
jgi:hypothetical protein